VPTASSRAVQTQCQQRGGARGGFGQSLVAGLAEEAQALGGQQRRAIADQQA
jgi:hypothetical protein